MRESGRTGFSRREFLVLTSGAVIGGMVMTPGTSIANYHHKPMGEPRYGGAVKVGDRGFQPGMDPHRSGSWGGYLTLLGTHQGLTGLGRGVSLHPVLATHWDVNDDVTEFIFYLRQGVKFHTGQEMTSEDVVFSSVIRKGGYAFLKRPLYHVHTSDCKSLQELFNGS